MPVHRPVARSVDDRDPADSGSGAIPIRPMLRDDVPITWRDATTLEVGDPPRSVLLHNCTTETAEWILTLDGSAVRHDVLAAAVDQGIAAARAREILQLLDHARALDDLAVPPPLHDAAPDERIPLLGQAAALGHAYGSTETVREVMSARRRTTIEVSAGGAVAASRLAEPIAELLRAGGIGGVSVTPRALSTAADLHILARIGHPDVPADAGALPLRRVHLPVTTVGPRAVVGPLVEPGRTPCLRCISLTYGDTDPHWPQRSAQLMRPRRRRGLALALDAAVVAYSITQTVLLALAWVDSPLVSDAAPPPGTTSELRLPGAIPVTRQASFHPDCACRDRHCGLPESA